MANRVARGVDCASLPHQFSLLRSVPEHRVLNLCGLHCLQRCMFSKFGSYQPALPINQSLVPWSQSADLWRVSLSFQQMLSCPCMLARDMRDPNTNVWQFCHTTFLLVSSSACPMKLRDQFCKCSRFRQRAARCSGEIAAPRVAISIVHLNRERPLVLTPNLSTPLFC